ncbi:MULTISPECIES: hypothetical protein [Prauserella salsuginis group]|uniref:Uncharacterized protein n=1 Tax=Prauserella salsuginis TaxID=387889 RepID=A0ABW6G0I5_9PSEU|nr:MULTISPECIES: hypothetical protein [Prauserella salsuginis group]MCR3721327.1 hypothetical protein [Prauserella flava]MCR3734593.1 hypothetical protein [Prauserella salsuginis]
MSDDPERLLAEALRAQARNAPPAGQPAPQHTAHHQEAAGPTPVVETPGGYGLLSGAGEGSLERERAALDAQTEPPAQAVEPASTPESASASAGSGSQPAVTRTGGRHHRADTGGLQVTLPWIILLAAVLGLACGCVIGLLTIA